MGAREKYFRPLFGEKGLTLMEMVMAAAISFIVVGTAWGILVFSNRTYNEQKQVAWARENVIVAMRSITKNLSLAGYDPSGGNKDSALFNGITSDNGQLRIRMDLNGDGVIGSGEDIVYRYDPGSRSITRTAGGLTTPVARNIQDFTFQYLDAEGIPTAIHAAVRTVKITITGRTELPDPAYKSNNGYRTVTLTNDVSPKNLSIHG